MDDAGSTMSNVSLCTTATTLFFLPSMYTLGFVTAVPGNVLSLWIFTRRVATVSPTHVYLSHLSVSNLLLCVTLPFLVIYYSRGWAWTLRSAVCQLVLHGVTPVLHMNIYISLMILTCVALTRFAVLIQNTHASRPSACATVLPHTFFSRLAKVSFAKAVCTTMWMLAVAGIVPVTVYYSLFEASCDVSGKEEDVKGGCEETCYSPQVEIGGSRSATLVVLVIVVFFVLYLLVLLFYMTVARHIRRSHRHTHVTSSQSLLRRVLRNIVVIQVVLTVCLLPYHIFRPIFIALAHTQDHPPAPSYDANTRISCHPLSVMVEVKNCLFLLTALRGSTDPLMYFLLDRTFQHQTLHLLRRPRIASDKSLVFRSITGGTNQKAEQPGEENEATTTGDLSN